MKHKESLENKITAWFNKHCRNNYKALEGILTITIEDNYIVLDYPMYYDAYEHIVKLFYHNAQVLIQQLEKLVANDPAFENINMLYLTDIAYPIK